MEVPIPMPFPTFDGVWVQQQVRCEACGKLLFIPKWDTPAAHGWKTVTTFSEMSGTKGIPPYWCPTCAVRHKIRG